MYLRQTFSDRDTALLIIKDQIINFYKTGHTDFYAKNSVPDK